MRQIIFCGLMLMIFPSFGQQVEENKLSYKVDSLLNLMTLEEKLGQMTQLCFSTITLDGTKTLELNPDLFREAIVKHNVGSFLSGTGNAKQWAEFVTQMQDIAIKESRLGIPLIIGIDHVHGANYVDEGTIFPHNLTLSCSFNTDLIEAGAKVVAQETAPLALSWNFAPVLDVGKNPYWPRLYETFGEDPYVCSQLGSAFVRGYQQKVGGYQLAACAKHFVGYSDPKSGWDRTPSEIPDQILFEQFLPPFQAAFDAGVKTVMVNSGEVNGEPVHGSEYYLKEVLRTRMGFDGVVLTDIKDILKMVEMHSAFENYEAALLASINAGVDMAMSCNHNDLQPTLKKLVEQGKVTEARIDESVRRILKLKFELNLFAKPYPDSKRISDIGTKANYEVAKKSAMESVVMLKNDGTLPLDSKKKILVSGFAAHSKKMMNGPWTLEWLGAEEERHKNTSTLAEALQKEGGKNVTFKEIINEEDISAADVIVLTIGEEPYSEFKGNIDNLSLPKEQQTLIQTAIDSGKPVVLLLVEGRPRIITEYADDAAAILFIGYAGHGGAEAVTDLLYGKANPSGKLSFTYPRNAGYFSPYYHKVSEYHHSSSKPFTPLYEFGHGLSYSTFEYSELTCSNSLITNVKDSIQFTVKVKNTSEIDGKEAVLWFIQDEVGRITRPVKQLKHFEKKLIKAGKELEYSFTLIPLEHFTYPDRNGDTMIENGYFTITVGDQSQRIKLDCKELHSLNATQGR